MSYSVCVLVDFSSIVGSSVRGKVGIPVSPAVVCPVGIHVGLPVGDVVGKSDGCKVCIPVGPTVESTIGILVGLLCT